MTAKEMKKSAAGHRFGTFGGVFTPTILTILGIIMFMRANFVIGQAGILGALLILVIAQTISLATGFSISAISTNIKVRGGGLYFLISRVLGIEFGGAIGIALFMALAISVPFYVLGFGEALVFTFPELAPHFRLINLSTALLLFAVAYFGADLAIKTQYLIMLFLFISVILFLGGATRDFTTANFMTNLHADYSVIDATDPGKGRYTFWAIFAIYFPAVTGIAAGVNMSGDLRNPNHSIPRGTLSAIGVGFLIYLVQILLDGGAWPRSELSSNPFGLLRENALLGLANLVTLGVFAATLSSALTSYLGAPRILQAVSRDKILNFLDYFGKGSVKDDEPRRALFLTLAIAMAVIYWAGNDTGGTALNVVAAQITMFFLYSYGMINFAAFIEDYGGNPSFRPSFGHFHWPIALAGAIACTTTAFLVSWPAALLALMLIMLLLWYIKSRKLVASFGDARRGFFFTNARDNLLRLSQIPEHPKNWRPKLIAFSGNPDSRDILATYSLWIASEHGIVYLANILRGNFDELAPRRPAALQQLTNYCREKEFEAFPVVAIADELEEGVKMLLQGTSIGPIGPNLAVFGWVDDAGEHLASFVRQIRAAAALDMSLMLFYTENNEVVPERGERIDIWWRGQDNGNLMILIAHLISENWEWKETEIRLLQVIENEEGREPATIALRELIAEARVDIEPEVLVDTASFAECLAKHSRDATCVILGFNIPEEGKEEKWHRNYSKFLHGLPTTIIVNSRNRAELLI